MAFGGDIDARLPLYTYLRPLIEGRRVLEVGGRTRFGAEALLRLGAGSVVALVDDGALGGANGTKVRWLPTRTPMDALISAGPFDVVLLPEAASDLAPRGRLALAELARLLSPEGQLVLSAPSADQKHGARGGFTYYDLQDRLSELFPVVRMFGQTPFVALGIAEFDAAVSDLRVDAELIDPEAEEPTHYVALAGREPGPSLGYALVQVPAVAAPAEPVAVATVEKPAPRVPPTVDSNELQDRLARAEAQVKTLVTQLLDVQGQAEGTSRVARAQAEEIEELRGRVRRAAETRLQLDEEIARLRKALAQADESVLNLTRRTADEVSALAARLSSALIPAAVATPSPSPRVDSKSEEQLTALAQRLKQREAQLAQRESALFDRDERIAALEAEKQDLVWQLTAVQEQAAGIKVPASAHVVPAERDPEFEALLQSRGHALEEYKRAAAVHIREVARLRVAVAEQTAHIDELEEALAAAERRETLAVQAAAGFKVALAQAQEADRSRRTRLAELEGTLLRMRHAPSPAKSDDAELIAARRQVAEMEARVAKLEVALAEAERSRSAAAARCDDAVERLNGFTKQTETERDVVRKAHENVEQVARVAEEDVNRLRQALDRSEDQLRKARGQLLPLRGRVAMLEREKEARDAAERDLARTLVEEVSAIETGLREELGRIDEVSRLVAASRLGAPRNAGEGELVHHE